MKESKTCPFCAEEIKEDAIKCKHCGEWLSDKKGQPPPQSTKNFNEPEWTFSFLAPSQMKIVISALMILSVIPAFFSFFGGYAEIRWNSESDLNIPHILTVSFFITATYIAYIVFFLKHLTKTLENKVVSSITVISIIVAIILSLYGTSNMLELWG